MMLHDTNLLCDCIIQLFKKHLQFGFEKRWGTERPKVSLQSKTSAAYVFPEMRNDCKRRLCYLFFHLPFVFAASPDLLHL